MNANQEEQEKKLPIGYAYGTKHIVILSNELIKLTEELLEKTRAHSHWQAQSLSDRVEEARAIHALSNALTALVKAR